MIEQKPGLGVVIVTYNSAAHIGRCLDSLGHHPDQEIMVVDNGSSDDTKSRLIRRPDILQINNPTNRGYSAAANQGAARLSREFLCFLNPDCEAPSGFIAAALNNLQQHPDDCLVPAALIGPRGRIAAKRLGYTGRRLIVDILRDNYWHLPTRWMAEASSATAGWYWPHGACILIRRNLFRDIGGFDERYPMYMVDVEFGRRLHAAGHEIRCLEQDLVHHEGNGSAIGSVERLNLLNQGRITYGLHNYGVSFAALLSLLAWPGYLLRKTLSGTG
jgi:N-acetylglucosaminyl-diphospho-decaprenol L-rhamnosyltransferase